MSKHSWKLWTFVGNQLQNVRVCCYNGSTKYISCSKPHRMFVPYSTSHLRSVISRNRVHYAGKMIFESIYHYIHIALRYHQSNSWLVPVVLLVWRNFVDMLATVYSGYRHGFLGLCSQPRNKEISHCIADAPGTYAIQSLQSKLTVGENSFDIVKKCWNISNSDHHVQS